MRHHSEFDTFGGILGTLTGGLFVRSDVEPDDDGPPWMGRNVYLHGGDVYCDDCRELIHSDEWYGEAWVNVLARQKLNYGGTWCGACFQDATKPDDQEETDESDKPGRQFD